MGWDCKECGAEENPDESIECYSCGFLLFHPLKLVSTDTGRESRKIKLKLAFGKKLLDEFAGEDAQFASEPQFRGFPNPLKQWVLETVQSVKNPTFINGSEPIEDQTVLHQGDIISIGSRRGNEDKMKLMVHVEG